MPRGTYKREYRPAANFKDLVGQRFGKRIVIARAPTPIYNGKKGSSMWVVRCDCGRESTIQTCAVKNSTSCGCDLEYAVRSGETRRSPLPLNTRRNESHLRTIYGLSIEEFEKRRLEQNNRCMICQEEFICTPSVDHDHSCCSGRRTCGKCIRGLLCKRCNAGIGSMHDSIELLHRAIKYLEEFNIKKEISDDSTNKPSTAPEDTISYHA